MIVVVIQSTILRNIFIGLLVGVVEGKEFKIGLVMPFRHPRVGWENNAAGASMAVEAAQESGLLTDHNITIHYRDDQCSALGGTKAALDLHFNVDVDVFIGPPCSSSTTSAGLLATAWNIPMFSMASSDPSLADKTKYQTLVRLGPPFNRLGHALRELFQKYQWARTVIVSRRRTDNRSVFCDYSSRAVDAIFRTNNMTVDDWIIIDDGISDGEIDSLLIRVKQRGRIIILCSENAQDKRRILLKTVGHNMNNGDFVFITPDHLPPSNVATPWVAGDADDAIAKDAFKHVFQITVAEMAGPAVSQFRAKIPGQMAKAPWFYNATQDEGMTGSEYSPFLYDVVTLYLKVLNDTVDKGQDYKNGTLMFHRSHGKAFRGITGNVKVDSNGDREPDYWLWYMGPDGESFDVVIEARMTAVSGEKIHVMHNPQWGTKDNQPPPDTPSCGFSNELCPPDDSDRNIAIIVVISVLALITAVILGLAWYIRKMKWERELDQMLWQIHFDDIKVIKQKCMGSVSQMSLYTLASTSQTSNRLSSGGGPGGTQLFSSIGMFKGKVVAIKKLSAIKVTIGREDKVHFKRMTDLSHENINTFIGICLDDRFPCILTSYCSKGSLQDIIENEDIKLDWTFRVSLIIDMTNGMHYLHTSHLKVHGNLKSSNCLVDNRWVLKLGDFGLGNLKVSEEFQSEKEIYRGLFWTAPEILVSGKEEMLIADLQKADVYSYGIVLCEILHRCEPYDTSFVCPKEIIDHIKHLEYPPYRPTINHRTNCVKIDDAIPQFAIDLMERCYDQIPEKRPSFDSVRSQWHAFNKGRRVNIVDNMLTMLERYANNLEDIVEQRTCELVEERKKSDLLLYRMLPRTVADKLKIGVTVMPEIFESVTIYFSDIVGFTTLASESTPIQVVDLLNDLYTSFDSILAQHDVYKVETIGDAYMVVSGLPEPNGKRHAAEVANMALDLLKVISSFKIKHRPSRQLLLRIGLHSGPCAAGVVGLTMPRYCLFGDTVNMASRMESNGEGLAVNTVHSIILILIAALKIHVSEDTCKALMDIGEYSLEKRGSINIKGKGLCETYWLLSKAAATEIDT